MLEYVIKSLVYKQILDLESKFFKRLFIFLIFHIFISLYV